MIPTTQLPEVPFPDVIDSSMLGAYKACPRKFYYSYLRHLKAVERSVHLVAGGAYAAGLEVARLAYWRDGLKPADALAKGLIELIRHYGDFIPPADSPKSLGNMMLALCEYFDHYKWGDDLITPHIFEKERPDGTKYQHPAVEFSFSIPLPGLINPTTGEDIHYVGRFDLLGVYKNALYAVDEKTTTRLGPSWARQWTLRSQFIGYCWAARQYGFPVAGAIVRGISILKNDFGHAEVQVPVSPQLINSWLETTYYMIERMIEDWKAGHFVQDFDSACTSYSGCAYMLLCDKSEPEKWITTNFVESKWEPLAPGAAS